MLTTSCDNIRVKMNTVFTLTTGSSSGMMTLNLIKVNNIEVYKYQIQDAVKYTTIMDYELGIETSNIIGK